MQAKNAHPSAADGARKRGRPPQLRHPLGVLRQIIGKTQQEFAHLLGDYSHHTIEAIERGVLELSEGLAKQVSAETDINVGWLLRGNAKAPPLDTRERPYTKETFERTRVRARVLEHPCPVDYWTLQELRRWGDKHYQRLLGIMASAVQKGTVDLCDYRLTEALDVLERRFGHVQNVKSVKDVLQVLCQKPGSQDSPKAGKVRRKHTKKPVF